MTPKIPMQDDEIKMHKPISAEFVDFRAGIRCAERVYDVAALIAERDALKAENERYQWLAANAYVGIAPHPKPHEVWCLRLPNPNNCNNLDAAIDAAMKGQA